MDEPVPLAEILRPKTLDDVIGQDHLAGSVGILRKLLNRGFLPSMIFWGPPGSGKTTLALLLADLTGAVFESKSAVTTGLSEVRSIIGKARDRLDTDGRRTVFFIDEIHRFNKAQQDALLPHVEKGSIIFIGATTENPSFEVISPLLSRCRVLVLNPLTARELSDIADRGLIYLKRKIEPKARDFLISLSNGDARTLLTVLEIAGMLTPQKTFSVDTIETAAQRKVLQYDTGGEEHYNTISAFIKSMRGSDTDAALYYLARMVAAGEDPLFIARRMVIFASEDIGLAQPTALVVANGVFDACHKVGYPEAQIILAHGTCYLAQAKKNRSAYEAYFSALDDVKSFGNLPIPMSLRNAPTKLMKGLGYGAGYQKYGGESRLPDRLRNRRYFRKSDNSG
ncbi:AAA family ATPase [Candidatus Gottesmanbacteria bacterium RBG_16_52_11]|uniref:AAA family ATPase n=1 Tax=Candidatus Gottesmanbacteria bacterium RBG_16_52_11 TaxID=1798374 RepID=A0A1F5YQQ1_9BACT|nr:MAG: AAA family ATPase [Candidatus Gottesmanbacteria bacterium RBG_16_52_11]